jgi:hypothetical protein
MMSRAGAYFTSRLYGARLPDGVQPTHDSGLHCDPMVRKRMFGAHVLLGNLGTASLPQGFCQCLVVRSIAIISFEDEYGPLLQKRDTVHVIPFRAVAINFIYQLLGSGANQARSVIVPSPPKLRVASSLTCGCWPEVPRCTFQDRGADGHTCGAWFPRIAGTHAASNPHC